MNFDGRSLETSMSVRALGTQNNEEQVSARIPYILGIRAYLRLLFWFYLRVKVTSVNRPKRPIVPTYQK